MAVAGLLEPYSLFISLGIDVPTIALSAYSYTRICRSPTYKGSQYLRVYCLKGVNDTLLYLLGLFVLKLPLQNFMHFFYLDIDAHSNILIVVGMFLVWVARFAHFGFGISLSLNRFFAVARVLSYSKYNKNYTRNSLIAIYPIPIIFAARFVIWIPKLGEHKGLYGPVFIVTPEGEGIAFDVVKYAIILYYVVTSLVQFILNVASFVYYVKQKETIYFTQSNANKTAEVGLLATTFMNCLVALLFTALQIIIQFFPQSPLTGFARSGTTIIVDVMALMHIYLLIAFSPKLRQHLRLLFPCAPKIGDVAAPKTVIAKSSSQLPE